MSRILLAAGAVAAMLVATGASHAASVPCEDALNTLRALQKTAHPSDAEKAQVDQLMQKGIERCNADDDKRADDLFAQATQILTGK